MPRTGSEPFGSLRRYLSNATVDRQTSPYGAGFSIDAGRVRYAITTTIVFAIVWARIHWSGGELERYPFLVFIPVILGSGALLDRGNGFLATGLSTGLVDYYILPPLGSMAVASGQDQAALALFFFTGVLISLVVEALHVGLVDLAIEHEKARAAVERPRASA